MTYARGEFITFMDADDWYCEYALDYLVNYLKNVDADLFVFNYYIVFNSEIKEKQWEPSYQGVIIDFLKDKIISTVWNKVYKKSIIERHDMNFPGFLFEDSVFNW